MGLPLRAAFAVACLAYVVYVVLGAAFWQAASVPVLAFWARVAPALQSAGAACAAQVWVLYHSASIGILATLTLAAKWADRDVLMSLLSACLGVAVALHVVSWYTSDVPFWAAVCFVILASLFGIGFLAKTTTWWGSIPEAKIVDGKVVASIVPKGLLANLGVIVYGACTFVFTGVSRMLVYAGIRRAYSAASKVRWVKGATIPGTSAEAAAAVLEKTEAGASTIRELVSHYTKQPMFREYMCKRLWFSIQADPSQPDAEVLKPILHRWKRLPQEEKDITTTQEIFAKVSKPERQMHGSAKFYIESKFVARAIFGRMVKADAREDITDPSVHVKENMYFVHRDAGGTLSRVNNQYVIPLHVLYEEHEWDAIVASKKLPANLWVRIRRFGVKDLFTQVVAVNRIDKDQVTLTFKQDPQLRSYAVCDSVPVGVYVNTVQTEEDGRTFCTSGQYLSVNTHTCSTWPGSSGAIGVYDTRVAFFHERGGGEANYCAPAFHVLAAGGPAADAAPVAVGVVETPRFRKGGDKDKDKAVFGNESVSASSDDEETALDERLYGRGTGGKFVGESQSFVVGTVEVAAMAAPSGASGHPKAKAERKVAEKVVSQLMAWFEERQKKYPVDYNKLEQWLEHHSMARLGATLGLPERDAPEAPALDQALAATRILKRFHSNWVHASKELKETHAAQWLVFDNQIMACVLKAEQLYGELALDGQRAQWEHAEKKALAGRPEPEKAKVAVPKDGESGFTRPFQGTTASPGSSAAADAPVVPASASQEQPRAAPAEGGQASTFEKASSTASTSGSAAAGSSKKTAPSKSQKRANKKQSRTASEDFTQLKKSERALVLRCLEESRNGWTPNFDAASEPPL